MRSSRSDGKSGLRAILAGVGKALVWGSVLVLAINAHVPRRLIELYRSLSSGSGTSRPEIAGSGAPPKAETLAAAAGNDSDDRIDEDSRQDEAAMAGAGTGSGDVAASEASGGYGLTDAGGGPGDAAGDRAPDAQGLILMDDMDAGDRGPGDAGVADTSIDTASPAEPAGWTIVEDSDEAAMEEAGLTGDEPDVAGEDAPDQAEAGQDMGAHGPGHDPGEQVPGVVAEDQDAVPGDGTTECPPGFPIKGNGRSRLYHLPEGFAYARTKPELCFRTPEAAEKAGFRRAKG